MSIDTDRNPGVPRDGQTYTTVHGLLDLLQDQLLLLQLGLALLELGLVLLQLGLVLLQLGLLPLQLCNQFFLKHNMQWIYCYFKRRIVIQWKKLSPVYIPVFRAISKLIALRQGRIQDLHRRGGRELKSILLERVNHRAKCCSVFRGPPPPQSWFRPLPPINIIRINTLGKTHLMNSFLYLKILILK